MAKNMEDAKIRSDADPWLDYDGTEALYYASMIEHQREYFCDQAAECIRVLVAECQRLRAKYEPQRPS